VQYYGLSRLAAECSTLLSAVAWAGTADADEAATAWERGAEKLRRRHVEAELQPFDDGGFEALGAALVKLDLVAPRLKRDLLEACAATVSADGRVTLAEAELLRAIADSLGSAAPPLASAREV
jgi:hypothetical protein